jgi:hypothetical protein
MTLVLLALGAGIGFSVMSPWSGAPDITTAKAATVGGIFMAVTAVMSSALGGYITGRLRTRWAGVAPNEVYFRDTANGVLAWAFATVMGAALLASAATIVSGGAAAGAGPAAALAAVGGEGRSANAWQAPLLDRLFRPDYAALTSGTGQRAAGVFAGGRDLAIDRAAANRLFASAFDRPGGAGLAADDRQYLAQMVAARTGLPPAEAERRVAAIETEAKIAADTARRIAMHLSFWLVASMLMGAVAAGLAATEGGAARDGRS